MNDDLWIVIPNWERFQHYKNRNPTWIKLYTELASDSEWDSLTLPQRGLLVTIWIEYASSRGRVRIENVRRRVGISFRNASVEALNHAGFIELSASKPLALCYHGASPDKEEDEDKEEEQTNHPSVARDEAPFHGEEPPENGWTGLESENGQERRLPDLATVLRDMPA